MPSLNIEYLEKFRELESRGGEDAIMEMLKARRPLCRQYSFAIPTIEAVEALISISPLVEIGAGTGYWTMLVSQSGGDITAYDKKPSKGNKYAFTHTHTEVFQGDESVLSSIDKRFSLFLCWPNYDNDFAYNCLRRFKGNTLAYAGEARGGCTANDKFFELLEVEWTLSKHVSLPQWFGINDSLFLYDRKTIIE